MRTKETRARIFSTRLKTLMEAKNLTQKELANEVGCVQNTIWRATQGESLPGPIVMETIADYFGVRLSWLLGEEPTLREALGMVIKGAGKLTQRERIALIEGLSSTMSDMAEFKGA